MPPRLNRENDWEEGYRPNSNIAVGPYGLSAETKSRFVTFGGSSAIPLIKTADPPLARTKFETRKIGAIPYKYR